MEMASSNKSRFWFPLDNAAKIFPAIISDEVSMVFRLTAVLKSPVKIKPFLQAVLLVEKRFPYYQVQLKEGFFWFYLEHLPEHIPVKVDNFRMCQKFLPGDILTRILVRGTQVSVEFSHIVTDGSGGLEFLKSLLIAYSTLCGAKVPPEFPYVKPDSPMSEEEYEDAYNRYFKQEIPPIVKRSKAFHLPFPLNPRPRFATSSCIISVSQIKQVASLKQVNITVYLVSVYLFVLQQISNQVLPSGRFGKKGKTRLQVPVNLRNIFPTKTLRNFSLFIMPEIDLRLGHYTFDEILKSVYHQIKLEADEKLINKNISRNVGGEKKMYVRGIPLFLKSALLRMKYYSQGTSQYSGVLSNLGNIVLPPDTGDLVDHFMMVLPPPNKMLKINCGVTGFGDKLVLTFGNITKSREFEDKFIDFLQSQGIFVETVLKSYDHELL